MTAHTLWTVFTWTFSGILCTCRFLWICPYNAVKFTPRHTSTTEDRHRQVNLVKGNEFVTVPGSPDRTNALHKRLVKSERDILTLKTRFACERASWERRFTELQRQQEGLRDQLNSKDGGSLTAGSCEERGESGKVFHQFSRELHHHRGFEDALRTSSGACTLSGSWLTSASSSPSSSSSLLSSRPPSSLSSASSGRSWRSFQRPHRVFVPHSPLDLQLGHQVRVLLPSGKISTGTLRFLGLLQGEPDLQLGVELLSPEGGTQDGNREGHPYFECKPGHGAFVPFHKLLMVWE